MSAKELQFEVFTPTAPLSGTYWKYNQYVDGTGTREVLFRSKSSATAYPLDLDFSPVFPNALEWARCLHSGKPKFEKSPEASEIYAVLCNVALAVEQGDSLRARVCLEGVIQDCKEWIRRINTENWEDAA